MPRPVRPLAERFWEKVARTDDDDGCWLWLAGKDKDGYGKVQALADGRRDARAHQVAWYLTYGEWPPADKMLLHSCDNRSCVRPAHLRVGTNEENMADMVARGRLGLRAVRGWRQGARGSSQHLAKLQEGQVLEILARVAAGGVTKVQLAREYNVTDCTIRDLVKGRSWRWLKRTA